MRTSKLEALTREDDARCFCGWKLPLNVTPTMNPPTNKDSEETVEPIPGASTVLRCPDCDAGHTFILVDPATFSRGKPGLS